MEKECRMRSFDSQVEAGLVAKFLQEYNFWSNSPYGEEQDTSKIKRNKGGHVKFKIQTCMKHGIFVPKCENQTSKNIT